jgi:hypothetical protein
MKNRKREICTSGSVRDEAGQPPHLLGRRTFLCLAAGVAALPAASRMAWAQTYPAAPKRASAYPVPYALETDWPVGAAGFEPLHIRIGICQDYQPGAGLELAHLELKARPIDA